MGSGYSERDLPSLWARDYTGRALRLLRGAPGGAIAGLQARGLLAGVPPEILVAFIATGFPSSNTTDARAGKGSRVAFHEIGWWQIPAGPALRDAAGIPRGPAPNPDPSKSTWGRLHADPRVVGALKDDAHPEGRPAPMAVGAWKRDEPAQHAVGMAMLEDDFAAACRGLRPDVRPAAPATPWGTWVMFTSFSAGPGGATGLINHYADALARVPAERRIAALLNAVALDFAAGRQDHGHADTHGDREHRVLRTWQKFEFARRLSTTVEARGYFDVGLGDAAQPAHERAILRANWNLDPNASSTVAAIDFTAAAGPA